ncbi:DUF1804 family protein [Azospirillum agricola]|uniref:DUF1804 family protein n=1 Tax=Azospirillum agricola TaxID=1720247 RepID=UPI000A0F1EBF|nr:DUF1804 family protein [Azospirillum agricola]SMH62852.1 Protein of unknown function [Azospirillum lipoferum]
MAHGDATRADLRRAYVYDRLELPAAADRVAVSLSTARRWKSDAEAEGDDWEKARTAARLAGDGRQSVAEMILNDYLMLHQACMEEVKAARTIDPLKKAEVLSRLADAFNKTMGAVSKASPELSRLAVATDVIQRLAGFIRKRKAPPAVLEFLIDALDEFASELARDFA